MKTITIESLSKRYPQPSGLVRAVDDVSLHIDKGEFFFLLGPSGCGKTTLLRMIAGLVEPSAGRVFFGDQDVTNLPVEKRKTAMVFQNYALWPHMSVKKNVQFGPRMKGLDAADRWRICQSNLSLVEMQDYARRKPNQLSGGQQQRVALARALAAEPDCLLLDEPLSNLDARLRLHMRSELRSLVKSTGATAVYVTHDQKEALSMADRVAVMRDGKVMQVGTPRELYHRPRSLFVADFLGEANFLPGRVVGQDGQVSQVDTPLGRLRAGEPPPETGQDVTCCIRPERIELTAQYRPDPSKNVLAAEIVSSTFLGEIRQYVCRLGDTETTWRVTCLSVGGEGFESGQKVRLVFGGGDVVLLPGQADRVREANG
jgi:iron(III) transport system ATP-binding protein